MVLGRGHAMGERDDSVLVMIRTHLPGFTGALRRVAELVLDDLEPLVPSGWD